MASSKSNAKKKASTKAPKRKRFGSWKFPSNFYYIGGVDYDYSTDYPCNSGCDYDYCRCSTISDASAKCVNPLSLASSIAINSNQDKLVEVSEFNKLMKQEEKNKIFFEYGIDRLIRVHELWDADNWSINKCRGYYGEEIDSISLDNHDFSHDVIALFKMSPSEKIEFLLTKEYGFLLDDIKGKNWIEVEVDMADLVVPNQDYSKKLTGVKHYQDHVKREYDWQPSILDLPIGIYAPLEGGKYKIIDGYNRHFAVANYFSSNKKLKNKKVKIITYKEDKK